MMLYAGGNVWYNFSIVQCRQRVLCLKRSTTCRGKGQGKKELRQHEPEITKERTQAFSL